MAVFLNKNSFHRIHKLPPFYIKTTFARIDFLRQDERLVDKKGTHNVNFIAKNWTKRLCRKRVRVVIGSEKLYACDGKGEQLQGMPLTYCMM